MILKKNQKKGQRKGQKKESKQLGRNANNFIEPVLIETNSDGEETILNLSDIPTSLFENPTKPKTNVSDQIDMVKFLTNKKSINNNLMESEFDPNDDKFMFEEDNKNNENNDMGKLAELTQNDNLLLRRMILKNEPFDHNKYEIVMNNSHKLFNYYLKHDPMKAAILKDSINFLNKLIKKNNIKTEIKKN